MIILDLISLIILRTLTWMLTLLPYSIQHKLIHSLVRLIVLLVPSFKKVSFTNLSFVFPNLSNLERKKIFQDNLFEIARLITDTINLPKRSDEWVKKNVQIDYDQFKVLKLKKPFRPVLYATGHLGSFALMAHSASVYGFSLNFVVRNFNLKLLDRWWQSLLQLNGNKVIPRQGAVKTILKCLSDGQDCALLFDQNVKRNYAIFTDWFGKKAATTFALGLTALKTKAHVVVASMKFDQETNKYSLISEICDCNDIYDNQTMSQDEKILLITERAGKMFQTHILNFPQGWFWMHRRWKTTPEGQKETFYNF